MKENSPKELLEARSKVAKALAHPARLKLIDILNKEGDKCVRELTGTINLSQSSISKHLKILKSVGIVTSKKEGVKSNYSLRATCVVNFFSCMDEVLRENLNKQDLNSYL